MSWIQPSAASLARDDHHETDSEKLDRFNEHTTNERRAKCAAVVARAEGSLDTSSSTLKRKEGCVEKENAHWPVTTGLVRPVGKRAKNCSMRELPFDTTLLDDALAPPRDANSNTFEAATAERSSVGGESLAERMADRGILRHGEDLSSKLSEIPGVDWSSGQCATTIPDRGENDVPPFRGKSPCRGASLRDRLQRRSLGSNDAPPEPAPQVDVTKGPELRERLRRRSFGSNPPQQHEAYSAEPAPQSPGGSALRERLRRRSFGSNPPQRQAEAPTSAQVSGSLTRPDEEASPKFDAEPVVPPDEDWASGLNDHKALGGISLRWRLLLRSKEAAAGKARARGSHNQDEASVDVAETSPRRSPTQRVPEKSAPRSPSSASPCASRIEATLPVTTPPPSSRQARETPTPPSSQSQQSCKNFRACESEFGTAAGSFPPKCEPEPSVAATSLNRSSSLPALSSQRLRGGTSLSPEVNASVTVKDLKSRLAEHKIDCTGCVEKADLEALWHRFRDCRDVPVTELRRRCVAVGADLRWAITADADECARFIALQERDGPPTTMPQPRRVSDQARPSFGRLSDPGRGRRLSEQSWTEESKERTAPEEIVRILRMRKESFPSLGAWGLAVLGAPPSLPAVQRAYRTLMKKLHPDKVGSSPSAACAFESLHEAKRCCERYLSQQEPPGQPRGLKASTLCAVPGNRRIRLEWQPPDPDDNAPVRRYLVSALDPSYGRPITVTTLEPDYSEEQHRFVPVEELSSFILAEDDLRKMPSLFQQPSLTLQVAAANEAGQSSWATIQVPLGRRR